MLRAAAVILSLFGTLGLPALTEAAVHEDEFQISVRKNDTVHQPDGAGPFPAIILLHGCGGPSRREGLWAEQLRHWGYLGLRVNGFAPRGLKSVCAGGILPPEERVTDVLAALAYLRSRSDVDPRRIALMGWSHGGSTTLMTMSAAAEEPEKGFRAAIAFYPGCSRVRLWRTRTPTLILIGELDDWSSAASCQKLSLQQQSAGFEVMQVTYPGAHHGFDNSLLGTAKRRVPEARGGRGATRQYNPAAAQDSLIQVQQFLAKHLQS